jgi:hypothetical protein
MILLTQDGYEIEWEIKLDRDTRAELARWRDFVEARLSMPAGTLAAFQWDEAGELQIAIRKEKLLGT